MNKILVIEDSEALLNDIVEMLTLEGYETRGAHNGEVGINMLDDYHPDLIICDIRMPKKDGYAVLNEVRSNPATMNIPFIFLTARTGRREIRDGMEMGADDYVPKPFTADELISSVQTRLDRTNQYHQETDRKLGELRKSIALALPHEMRTPLNSIMGFSEIMITDGDTLAPKQIQEMAQFISDSATRLYRITENYVIYANLELMSTDPERREMMRQGITHYPIIILMQQAQEVARQHNREDDLEIDMDDYFDGAVAADSENFARIAYELTDNAFKFSKSGKKVKVTAKIEDDGFIITILDQGGGMTEDEIKSVGPYMQFRRTVIEQQGIGFGLAISQRLVELYGGSLEIRSSLSEFTEIKVRLRII